MFERKFVEGLKAHVLCPITFFYENHAVYEIMWNNMVQPDRPQMTVYT